MYVIKTQPWAILKRLPSVAHTIERLPGSAMEMQAALLFLNFLRIQENHAETKLTKEKLNFNS